MSRVIEVSPARQPSIVSRLEEKKLEGEFERVAPAAPFWPLQSCFLPHKE
jgi:hypothetical protein